MSTTYKPGNVPEDPMRVPAFLREELARIHQALTSARDFDELRVLHAEPSRVRDGMEVEADGTDWNPGSGAGKYVYRSGAWAFIG